MWTTEDATFMRQAFDEVRQCAQLMPLVQGDSLLRTHRCVHLQARDALARGEVPIG